MCIEGLPISNRYYVSYVLKQKPHPLEIAGFVGVSWSVEGENQALDRPRLLGRPPLATIYGHINILHTQPAIMPLK